MDHHFVLNLALFSAVFLGAISLLHSFSKKYSVPYTVLLFLVGFAMQAFNFGELIGLHSSLPTDFIFYLLLPLLLFESALHINFHQFKLQFRTITFISTFGLLVSIFLVSLLLPLLIGMPLQVALLFGAIISATDPVAVLALFKTLPVPNRLALLVDGESMLNDGTGVIAFKLVSSLVIGSIAFNANNIFSSVGQFSYVFVGAMLLGLLVGLATVEIINRVKDDRIIETTLTLASALGSFILAEHFLHVSGVITTVMTGIIVGNFGATRFSPTVDHFIEDFWDYVAFIVNSIVFFFIGFMYHPDLLSITPIELLAVIGSVLIARSGSVYLSFAITNKLPIFKDEPNVPLKWQHLINWGGLRGTIPIILVFTIPDSYGFKEELVTLTLTTVMFTLLVNGSTVTWLLKKLGLHLPSVESEIIDDEMKIFTIHKALDELRGMREGKTDPNLIRKVQTELRKEEQELRQHIRSISNPELFLRSLKLQGLAIERRTLEKLLHNGQINENVYYDFAADLDLQQDFVEFNSFSDESGTYGNGLINSQSSYRRRLNRIRRMRHAIPILGKMFKMSENELILDRYVLLRARIETSREVLAYIDHIEKIVTGKKLKLAINKFRLEHNNFIQNNSQEAEHIASKYNELLRDYHENALRSYIGQSITDPHSLTLQ